MRRAAAIVGALGLVIATASVFAQATPNFAGTWTLVPAEGGGGGGGGRGGGRGGGFGGGGCGQECTITQDAATLTIARAMGENTITMKYTLDGSESSNTVMGRGGEMTQVSKAVWEGDTLVITTAAANGEIKMVLSMADGMMSISTTRPGRQGGAPVTTAQQYKKN